MFKIKVPKLAPPTVFDTITVTDPWLRAIGGQATFAEPAMTAVANSGFCTYPRHTPHSGFWASFAIRGDSRRPTRSNRAKVGDDRNTETRHRALCPGRRDYRAAGRAIELADSPIKMPERCRVGRCQCGSIGPLFPSTRGAGVACSAAPREHCRRGPDGRSPSDCSPCCWLPLLSAVMVGPLATDQ